MDTVEITLLALASLSLAVYTLATVAGILASERTMGALGYALSMHEPSSPSLPSVQAPSAERPSAVRPLYYRAPRRLQTRPLAWLSDAPSETDPSEGERVVTVAGNVALLVPIRYGRHYADLAREKVVKGRRDSRRAMAA